MLQAGRCVCLSACEVAGGQFDLVIYFVGEGRGQDSWDTARKQSSMALMHCREIAYGQS